MKNDLAALLDGWDGTTVRVLCVPAGDAEPEFGQFRFAGFSLLPAQVAGVASIALASPAQREYDGRPHPSILAACDYGEAVAEKAYRDALDDKELIWQDKLVVSLLTRHLKGLVAAHEHISELRQQTSPA